MISLLFLSFPQASLPLATSSLLQSVAQEDVLEEKVSLFKKIIKGKGQEPLAINHIDGFATLYSEAQERREEIEESLEFKPEDVNELKKELKNLESRQKAIADVVWYSFRRKRETKEHNTLWKAATYAFGRMPHHGAKYLWKAFEDKRFNRDVEFRSLCVKQVGFTRDLDQIEDLLDLLDYKDEVVAAAAGEALSQYRSAPGDVRKECTKSLVKMLESYHNASLDREDSGAVREYRTVRDPFLRALTTFTNESYRDPLEWTRWWNKNKKKSELWKDD
ncbi:MAG TPA: hypothetical protein QGG59_05585 [Planctomycetota bacterium]|jgi:hypothetical protein|nr:hypothetical protein [Planctomycetota bacterium]MDP7245592.1 hypothetical protein [Planctomycetota bacterium]HJM39568.1 hypothetical protein [Planctomycetota bacterium]|tara:strand:+ start:43645 stop:44475 length:831 start_codon:yes stop_codon:yes gene_type:complete